MGYASALGKAETLALLQRKLGLNNQPSLAGSLQKFTVIFYGEKSAEDATKNFAFSSDNVKGTQQESRYNI